MVRKPVARVRAGCNPGDSCDAHARKTVSARKCLNGLHAAELGHNNFTASNGWLKKWQKRYNVRMGVLSGEAADVDPSVISDWGVRLKWYALRDIFNADEMGLF